MPVRGLLLFDLDGTLVDAAPDLAASLNRLLAGLGAPPLSLSEATSFVGDGARVLVRRALAARGLDAPLDAALARFLALYEAHLCEDSRLYPGVAEGLSALAEAGWRLAVCTNKPQRHSEALLAALGIADRFAAVAGGDRFAVRKPDRGHVDGTARLAALPEGPAVMIGDGVNDLLAARSAGIPGVWAAYGYGGPSAASAAEGCPRITAFAELPAVLAAVQPAGLCA